MVGTNRYRRGAGQHVRGLRSRPQTPSNSDGTPSCRATSRSLPWITPARCAYRAGIRRVTMMWTVPQASAAVQTAPSAERHWSLIGIVGALHVGDNRVETGEMQPWRTESLSPWQYFVREWVARHPVSQPEWRRDRVAIFCRIRVMLHVQLHSTSGETGRESTCLAESNHACRSVVAEAATYALTRAWCRGAHICATDCAF